MGSDNLAVHGPLILRGHAPRGRGGLASGVQMNHSVEASAISGELLDRMLVYSECSIPCGPAPADFPGVFCWVNFRQREKEANREIAGPLNH